MSCPGRISSIKRSYWFGEVRDKATVTICPNIQYTVILPVVNQLYRGGSRVLEGRVYNLNHIANGNEMCKVTSCTYYLLRQTRMVE